jgi:DNA modification methylase
MAGSTTIASFRKGITMHKGSSLLSKHTNGEANKIIVHDRPIHDWYRFVLSFPPHLVRTYLERFEVKKNQTILDPFCGTGTTMVECKKLGLHGVGVEAHPMAHFAGTVKTDWAIDPDDLLEHANMIAEEVNRELAQQDIQDDFDCSAKVQAANLLSLPSEAESLLLTKSISPMPLHKALVLLTKIQSEVASRCHQYELLALAKGLVTTIGNLHFGPEVGVSSPKSDAPVISTWLSNIQGMVADLRQFAQLSHVCSNIIHADSRQIAGVLEPQSVDAVITSPPYPNEKDYTRTTRLESVILGLVNTKKELQALKRGLLRSNTRNVYKSDDDDAWVADNRNIQAIANEIEARRIALGKTSGFERMYARVTRHYFGGMARHFHELKAALRPGAQLAYVVGDQASYLQVMIRTGQLLAEIAQEQGYELLGIDLFRTRLATATRQQLREEVVMLRWNGKK